jgi:hypothetical protein
MRVWGLRPDKINAMQLLRELVKFEKNQEFYKKQRGKNIDEEIGIEE